MSELSRRWSPYNYANNNSIRFIDPDGRRIIDPNGNEHSENAEGAQAMFQSLQNNTGDPEKKKKEKKKEQVGSYTVTFESDKRYHGKGPLSRGRYLLRRKQKSTMIRLLI